MPASKHEGGFLFQLSSRNRLVPVIATVAGVLALGLVRPGYEFEARAESDKPAGSYIKDRVHEPFGGPLSDLQSRYRRPESSIAIEQSDNDFHETHSCVIDTRGSRSYNPNYVAPMYKTSLNDCRRAYRDVNFRRRYRFSLYHWWRKSPGIAEATQKFNPPHDRVQECIDESVKFQEEEGKPTIMIMTSDWGLCSHFRVSIAPRRYQVMLLNGPKTIR